MKRLSSSFATALLIAAGSLGGAACGSSGPGGGGTGGVGGGACETAATCPGADTDCRQRTCTNGACGFSDAPAGTALTQQVTGDCQVTVCDGKGATALQDDPTDVLDDGNACTSDACVDGAAVNTPLAAGAVCAVGAGKLCDGHGACVECLAAEDCASQVCTQSQCVPASCTDKVANGGEADVDCGGPDCGPCADGQKCGAASDCQSGVCTGGACQAPTCTDGVKNGAETGKDCGDACPPCGPGEGCVTGSDCVGGDCSGAVCVPTCTDKVKNANETDVDCGGPTCAGCPDLGTCAVATDCQSGVCTAGVCQVPTCTDGVENGAETALDCGASCPPCAAGLGCGIPGDCQSGVCTASVCAQPVCGDGVTNGTDACDDGNTVSGDGCSASCAVEVGFHCAGTPSACVTLCGDGARGGAEACDDGNAASGDGCDATCKVESYFKCTGQPSACARIKILYAPSNGDDATYRAAIAAITGGAVSYQDAATSTPTTAALGSYDCVHTFPNVPYQDKVGFGNNLADYVDAGGVVVLGVYATYTNGYSMGGRIMTSGYSPVVSPAGTNHRSLSAYTGNGATFLHNLVTAYSSSNRDFLAIQGAGVVDGTYQDGEIAHAYRPDFRVVYSNGSGAAGIGGGTGDWARLIANACAAAYRR